MAKHSLRYGDGVAEMAACATCFDSSADDNLPGPLGVKIDDENSKLNVALVIPGVKKPGLFGMGKNTRVDAKFDQQSLRILVEIYGGKSKSKSTAGKCLYKVKKLPDRIIPEQCQWEIRKDQIILTIRKEKVGSWQHILDQQGLETADEE